MADNAVFYGASYERSDGAVIVFLGMSTSHQDDGQAFADGVIKGTITDGEAFPTGIAGVTGVEGESNGVALVAIAFARNGRGFAVMSFGGNARDDSSGFVKFVVGLAESTPTRSDAKQVERLRPAAVGIAAFIALAVVAIVALWRFVRRRRTDSHRAGPTTRPGPHSGQPANPWVAQLRHSRDPRASSGRRLLAPPIAATESSVARVSCRRSIARGRPSAEFARLNPFAVPHGG